MALLRIENIKIEAISSEIPNEIHRNDQIVFLSDEEKQNLIASIGINERQYAPKGTTAADLCLIAAEKIFQKHPEWKSEIKILILVTQTPDYPTPASSIILQSKLGIGKDVIAFDINLGCSGYVYGLSVIALLLNNIREGKALLLVGDTSSIFVSQKDKSVMPLFSDAGSATVISYNENTKPMFFHLGSDGNGYDAIIVEGGGARYPFSSESLNYKNESEQIERNQLQMKLDGMRIMHFSLKEVPQSVRQVCEFAQIELNDIDQFYFHQANKIINEALIRKLKISSEKFPETLSKYGNTSSATIPITIVENYQNTHSKTLNLLCGFGVGLSWASAIVEFDNLEVFH